MLGTDSRPTCQNLWQALRVSCGDRLVKPMPMDRNDIISTENQIYLVNDGKVMVCLRHGAGRLLGLEVLGAGSIIGAACLFGNSTSWIIKALVPSTEVYAMGIAQVGQILAWDQNLLMELTELIQQQARRVAGQLDTLLFQKIPDRVAGQLLVLGRQHGKLVKNGMLIDCKLTHRDLAMLTGATRENVSLALEDLERWGILSLRRYEITITDLPRLKEVAPWG